LSALALRLVRADDLGAVYRIYMSEGVIDYLGYDPMPLSAFEPVFEEMLTSQAFYVAVAQLGPAQTIVGFCRLTRYKGRASHGAYLGTFAIDPSHWGRGWGQAVVRELAQRLQGDGVRRLELMMEADNPRAHRFYHQLGFIEEGRLRGAYQRGHQDTPVDEILMVLHLAPSPVNTNTQSPS
jgi:RimJ/RimL family protein N-acetyltransferase